MFVGIYHHRRLSASLGPAKAQVDVALKADEFFVRNGESVSKSWTSLLYDTFHDLRHAEFANSGNYPSGEQFMYDLEIKQEETIHEEVRLYRDRLTLLHLQNVHQLRHLSLSFNSGPQITHVLATSGAAPKTLFDFYDEPVQGLDDAGQNTVVIAANDGESMWCAIFSKVDGYTQITSKAYGSPKGDSGGNYGFAVMLVFGLVCGFLMLNGGFTSRHSDERGPSLLERLGSMVRSRAGHESTTSLTRGHLQGYSGSDVIDRSVEDQYLHRGGLGDEGL